MKTIVFLCMLVSVFIASIVAYHLLNHGVATLDRFLPIASWIKIALYTLATVVLVCLELGTLWLLLLMVSLLQGPSLPAKGDLP